jgi:hypothetical protein
VLNELLRVLTEDFSARKEAVKKVVKRVGDDDVRLLNARALKSKAPPFVLLMPLFNWTIPFEPDSIKPVFHVIRTC